MKCLPTMSDSSLSRRTKYCAECNESFSTTNNLKTHFERIHGNKPYREKGQTLLNFSAPSKRKYDEIQENKESNPSETPLLEEIDHPDVTHDYTPNTVHSPTRSHETDLSLLQQIQSVIDRYKTREFSNSTVNEGKVNVIPNTQVVGSSQCDLVHVHDEDVVDRIRVCSSLRNIEDFLKESFMVDRVDDIVRCITCVPDTVINHVSPGVLKSHSVEYEKENVQSRSLRHLKENMIKHLRSTTHQQNVEKKNREEKVKATNAARNREIGRKIGSLAYFFFYNKLPYLLFEKFLSLLSLNTIDIGQINHSEHFLRNLLDPCYRELLKRLRSHLNQVIPCTDHERPVTLLLDKGTIKHDTSQLTVIRTPCLKRGILFESFLVGNPTVTHGAGLPLTQLLVTTVNETLDWNKDTLRERFSGACADGQYIHLNLGDHLSEILHLPKDLMNDSVLWDAAHRLELACQHAKEGYSVGGQRVGGTDWLIELDQVLQHIMKIYRFGHNHSDLKKISEEMKHTFLEFNLFSETRFVEYSHRTYDHFVRMYPVLCEKLKRDETMAVSSKEKAESDAIQNLLVQLELVVDLLFMMDLSHLLTFISKEFQRFDVLPFYAMKMYWELKHHLNVARDSFN